MVRVWITVSLRLGLRLGLAICKYRTKWD